MCIVFVANLFSFSNQVQPDLRSGGNRPPVGLAACNELAGRPCAEFCRIS